MNKRVIGTKRELEAAEFIRKQGYVLLEKNFRCRIGEIDLIARDGAYLCFIEVKYRASTSKGFPAEAITPTKIHRITRTAQFYMLMHQLPQDTPCRFDAVVILGEEFSLIKNAFGGI